ncbi:MAG: ketopantoate reductase family protein [Spirochaetia bacterium]|nr:ketopantoate reductase family protein [Spirochaetia bacterium]
MNLDKSAAYNNIVVMGLGGVGGYFGGIFAINITSNWRDKRDLTFIARGAHLEAMKRNGLTLKLYKQDPVVCIPKVITDNILELPYVNFLLLAVKDYDLDNAVRMALPRLNNLSVIMPLQNGIDSYYRIKEIAPKAIVLPSCAYISSKIEAPGVVKLMGDVAKIYSGPDPERPDFDGTEIQDFFKNMGLKLYWTEKPFEAIWRKFLFVSPFALVTGATGKTMNEAYKDPELHGSILKIMSEIQAVAAKKGVTLTDYDIDYAMRIGENIDPAAKTSFQLDLENKKSMTEIDALGSSLVKYGRETGVETPETEKFIRRIVNGVL